jgi:hypothetical protein
MVTNFLPGFLHPSMLYVHLPSIKEMIWCLIKRISDYPVYMLLLAYDIWLSTLDCTSYMYHTQTVICTFVYSPSVKVDLILFHLDHILYNISTTTYSCRSKGKNVP